MRILVACCSITYEGRLVTRLASGERTILFKTDGSVVVHAAAGAKPINYMAGPTAVDEEGRTIRIARPDSGETLIIDVEDVIADTAFDLHDNAKLERIGREKEIQATLFANVEAIERGMVGLTRERFTEVGPVDLLCRDAAGRTAVIEVKRVRAAAAAVEQLRRYMTQVERDPAHQNARGILIAPDIAPQARVLCAEYGYEYFPLEEILARCADGDELMRLF